GHMAISPCGMFPLRSARRVEQTGLRQQNKWVLGMVSMPHGFLRRSNLLQSASQMYGCGAQAFGGPPRNRARQGVVNLEDAWAVTVLLQLMPIRRGQPLAGHPQQLARSHITQGDIILTHRG